MIGINQELLTQLAERYEAEISNTSGNLTTQKANNCCWAAAKSGRSERGQKLGPRSWPAKCTVSPKTDGHFGGQTKSAKRKFFKYYIQISKL
ncbi:hypothetical protein BpHYR1_040391 [Brachionus plicatilis]|uniref:Uncharacterized protein n=1 Tax=Brachionus plicatilis TaxID=10195 RepID=A0A3M7RAM5_BRAPC|nr:hypothetical protein BpHYR1_040391 [Brachionus plicatilis]